METTSEKTCIIVGASHAGVNFAFTLRNKGWEGRIVLIDAQSVIPYHRPPLSKTYFNVDMQVKDIVLKPEAAYAHKQIELMLGVKVEAIDTDNKCVHTSDDAKISYDKLVLAVGTKPRIPPIEGIREEGADIHLIRHESDLQNLRDKIQPKTRVTIVGGGYIGLEAAASIIKLGGEVRVLEMAPRVLARVTSPEMSSFYEETHRNNGVVIETSKQVERIEHKDDLKIVYCTDGTQFETDIVIVGTGIIPDTDLAESIGLELAELGIAVDSKMQTSIENIYSIGDCTSFYNKQYDRQLRLESVQNAVDQAKVAAFNICGKELEYDSIPWFWSDQYDIKLQIVGLSNEYKQTRKTTNADKPNSFSFWYFDDNDKLLAADCVNDTTTYAVATRLLKNDAVFSPSLLEVEDFNPRELLQKV